MANYLIGDVQGCSVALDQLLDTLDFSPSRDTLYLLGDLVNRGPDSLGVLRRAAGWAGAARCVLGNHDLHLLAVAHGVRPCRDDDTLQDVLAAPDRKALLAWLRSQPLALFEHNCLMVHAGVLPDWSVHTTLALAAEVQSALQAHSFKDFLRDMYGSRPAQWTEDLQGAKRLRVIVNALTRMRFCSASGEMEFSSKDGAATAPAGYMPWFEVPQRQTDDTAVAFGHWSTLGLLRQDKLLGLDTGCVWGGFLSACELSPQGCFGALTQVQCPQARIPGV